MGEWYTNSKQLRQSAFALGETSKYHFESYASSREQQCQRPRWLTSAVPREHTTRTICQPKESSSVAAFQSWPSWVSAGASVATSARLTFGEDPACACCRQYAPATLGCRHLRLQSRRNKEKQRCLAARTAKAITERSRYRTPVMSARQ